MKAIAYIKIITAMFMIAGAPVYAGEIGEAEVLSSSIRISQDGTGIIRFKECSDCDFIIARISSKTRVTENGRRTDVRALMSNAIRGFVAIQYDKQSKAVKTISYSK